MKITKKWIIPTFTLLIMFAIIKFLPTGTIDPWKLFNPKKMFSVIFALTSIQYIGLVSYHLLGTRTGAILTGFFGGLISSTATSASLAKKSKLDPSQKASDLYIITFLSATMAMLFEGIAIVVLGTAQIHVSILTIFIGPLLVCATLILIKARNTPQRQVEANVNQFNLLPILKLSIFIISILILSKVLQNFLGQFSLLILTFIVSLFEIHGSFIANIQLQDAGSIDPKMLGNLISISIVASYCSKLFLIYTLGSDSLKKIAIKYTLMLFIASALCWVFFLWLAH